MHPLSLSSPSQEAAGANETGGGEVGQLELLTAGPAVDGSHQAEQVRLFLAGEHDIMQRVFAEEDKDPQVEVCEEGVCVERREVGVCM